MNIEYFSDFVKLRDVGEGKTRVTNILCILT